ncbi:MAG: hypothetical protein LBF85_08865 [Tannerella sp.]|nr:hypothetical protein [Tannerella sp.]
MFTEKWVKPRGQIEEVFTGNETETYWNEVPLNVSEYQKRISEIIPETVFKMITNPLYFATQLKWQEQREQLFQLAGTISDADIATQKPEFAALLDRISGKSFADFKNEITARKKRLKADLAQIQPRIDQTHKLTPEASDFAALEAKIAELDQQMAATDEAIADKNKAANRQFEAVQRRQAEINALKRRQQQILFAAETKANEDAFAAKEARRTLENAISETEDKIDTFSNICIRKQGEIDLQVDAFDDKQKELQNMRQEWAEENAKEYAGDDICHVCKQPLPEPLKAQARALFEEEKTKTLDGMTSKGKKLSEQISGMEKSIKEMMDAVSEAETKLREHKLQLAELKAKLAAAPVAEEKEVRPEDLPEWAEISLQIVELEKKQDDVKPEDTSALQARKRELSAQLDRLKAVLKNRELIEQYTAEIAGLEAQGKSLAQQIADAEREEYIMQQFTKARIDECERRINGLFEHVTFKLFDYTIEGNEVETCLPLVAGVPFGSANTAGQINAGLDIINALTKFYGVNAPIFIDRRESINQLIKTDSQIIHLVVTKDKELIIK